MYAVIWLIDTALNLYIWALIISAILSILVSFGILDTRNRLVWAVGDFFERLTEPALRPIRQFLPNLGGIDLSPLVLILLLQAARIFLSTTIAPLVL
ncbi:YggT family protein [Elioraea sp.]|jgi:YggT family protein|uniref:YggT family protein n=1 Tax=Elioraea sp. TaxID=2185103 RepID=UPI0025B7AD41|nr:YggT family protein [Elioraea sp.]